MVKVLVDYSHGHTEQLQALSEKLNESYQGMPILFQVSWNAGEREGLQLWIDFEYLGERGFLSLDDMSYPASQIFTDWPDIRRSLDIELGLPPEPIKYAVGFDFALNHDNSAVWDMLYKQVISYSAIPSSYFGV